jgi:hypothetical protein
MVGVRRSRRADAGQRGRHAVAPRSSGAGAAGDPAAASSARARGLRGARRGSARRRRQRRRVRRATRSGRAGVLRPLQREGLGHGLHVGVDRVGRVVHSMSVRSPCLRSKALPACCGTTTGASEGSARRLDFRATECRRSSETVSDASEVVRARAGGRRPRARISTCGLRAFGRASRAGRGRTPPATPASAGRQSCHPREASPTPDISTPTRRYRREPS